MYISPQELMIIIASSKIQQTLNFKLLLLNFWGILSKVIRWRTDVHLFGRKRCEMAISYKKLWKLLIDRDMKKKDLCVAAGISHASMAKLGKNENVTTDVLVKICTALKCDISDIMEITETES